MIKASRSKSVDCFVCFGVQHDASCECCLQRYSTARLVGRWYGDTLKGMILYVQWLQAGIGVLIHMRQRGARCSLTARPKKRKKTSHIFKIVRQANCSTQTQTLISCGTRSLCQREACAHRCAFVICILMLKYVGRCLEPSVLIN